MVAKISVGKKIMAWGEKKYGSEVMSFSRLLEIFFPLLLDHFFMSLINVLNSSMVSSSGAAAVSAVSSVDLLNFFLSNIFIAMATGCTVVVAQYVGHGERDKVIQAMAQAILSSVAIAAALMVIFIVFSRQALNILFSAADAEILELANIYLIGSVISYPFFALMQTIVGALRGSGRTKISLMFTLTQNVLYIIGNFVFLNIFKLGVSGVAISLVFSRGVCAVWAACYIGLPRFNFGLLRQDFFPVKWELQKKILYIGIPAGLEQLFFTGGRLFAQTFVVTLGTMSITANAIANSVSGFGQVFAQAVGLCTITVIGQCIGAGDFKQAGKYMRQLCRVASVGVIATLAIMIPLLPAIIGLFNPPGEAYTLSYICTIICLVCVPFLWPNAFVVPQGLRAAGDAKFTSVTSLICMWAIRVVLGYLLAITFKIGIYGVWIAMAVEWLCKGCVFRWRLRGNKWYAHRLI